MQCGTDCLIFSTWKHQWPGLEVLSCWTHAQAGVWMDDVISRLGDVRVKPKGLLATEGISSVPEVYSNKSFMAAGSHFMEFMHADGACVMCDEVEIGNTYEIVLTTGAGFYRYRTMDIVRIDGTDKNGLPYFTFVGRSGRVSDMVGEKLDEAFVVECMRSSGAQGILSAEKGGYQFYTDDPRSVKKLEDELCKNPYYAQAVRLGQLSRLGVFVVPDTFRMDIIRQRAESSGVRLGDVKLPSLFLPGERKDWLE